MQCGTCSGVSYSDGNRAVSIFLSLLKNKKLIFCLSIFIPALIIDNYTSFFSSYAFLKIMLYFISWLIIGFDILKHALIEIRKGSIFTEFLLMSLATAGAFAIGQFAEAVSVMLFYCVGELLQDAAIGRARLSIKSLLDIRPKIAHVIGNNSLKDVDVRLINVGEKIQIKPGEKVPLDGKVILGESNFDTSAITGESNPETYGKGDKILSGMINLTNVIDLEITAGFKDDSVSKIIRLVEEAKERKAPAELLIRSFAGLYTKAVVFIAVLLLFVPYFFVYEYVFTEWLYRSLFFLVISCPCALVISIPLGYFAGIGTASRHGILFKGANYLDMISRVNIMAMDKTGTLTKGMFHVSEAKKLDEAFTSEELMSFSAALSALSNHPVSKAVYKFAMPYAKKVEVDKASEIPGCGMRGFINKKEILLGNERLLKNYGIPEIILPDRSDRSGLTILAVGGKTVGCFYVKDQEKDDSRETIERLGELGIEDIIMLSGDRKSEVCRIAKILKIKNYYADLLPEDKAEFIRILKNRNSKKILAFVGDGINDAPALAASDIGIAMGAMGSEVAIETADVVIQSYKVSCVYKAVIIARFTKKTVIQNIIFALVIKASALTLGAVGIASLWEAVFADAGVALLTIMNSLRIGNIKFNG